MFLALEDQQARFDFGSLTQVEHPEYPKGSSIAEQFALFHQQNPHVYLALVAMAKEKQRLGRKRMGMKLLFELMRDRYETTTRGDQYKLNNNYTAHYARLIMAAEPTLDGFFSTRERKGRQPER